MSGVGRGLRRTRDVLMGESRLSLIDRLARRDARWDAFVSAAEFVNYEAVPGDVVELGVFTGLSLALLARAFSFDAAGLARRIVGVDSFEGLPSSVDAHARWKPGDCAYNRLQHPTLAVGEKVTPAAVDALFDAAGLARADLYTGLFADVLPAIVPSRYPSIALAHVDCDLYESTHDALEGLAPALQDGTVLLFDDWFHYKGDPSKGEARAFEEFLSRHAEWRAVEYRTYGTFCKAFILSRR
jgi:O-methyltransferase